MLIINKLTKQLETLCKRERLYIVKRFITHNRWIRRRMENEELPQHRSDPIIKTLDSPEFKSILTPELYALANIFKKNNFEIRVAGGAVRDILMGIYPKDIDFATTATPAEMKDMFKKEEIRLINTNGEKHGTITSRINDKTNFEVTTLRIDVVTDGRHAEVEFTRDWLLDANRRDLTINSMFLDLDGKVYDYFYGYDDLMKRRVAFVGEPSIRIQEDFLRILRYFRFYGRICEVPDNHDEHTINAIKNNLDGLERISGERIWSEWSKILEGNFHRELTTKMIECGCHKYMGLPEKPNVEHFNEVCLRAQKNNIKLRPMSLIAALLNSQEEVIHLIKRLRFPNIDRNYGFFIIKHREINDSGKSLKPYQRLALRTMGKLADARDYICELLRYKGELTLLQEFEKWKANFPLNGNTLQPFIDDPKLTGEVLWMLKDVWVDHDCNMSVEKLQTYIPDIVLEAEKKWKEKEEMARLDAQKRKRSKMSM